MSTVGRGIETVETVSMSPAPDGTPLKRGVNESSQRQELREERSPAEPEIRSPQGRREVLSRAAIPFERLI